MPTHAQRIRIETVRKWHGEAAQPSHNLRADRCAACGAPQGFGCQAGQWPGSPGDGGGDSGGTPAGPGARARRRTQQGQAGGWQAGRMRTHPAKARREAVHHMTDRQRTLPNLASDRCRPRAPGPMPWGSIGLGLELGRHVKVPQLTFPAPHCPAARPADRECSQVAPRHTGRGASLVCWLAILHLRRLAAGSASARRSAIAHARWVLEEKALLTQSR